MCHYPKLQALLPCVKAAEDLFDLYLNSYPLGTTLVELQMAACPLNRVLAEAVEALIQDITTNLNDRGFRAPMEKAYLGFPEGCVTYGGLTHQKLLRTCTLGWVPNF